MQWTNDSNILQKLLLGLFFLLKIKDTVFYVCTGHISQGRERCRLNSFKGRDFNMSTNIWHAIIKYLKFALANETLNSNLQYFLL